MYLYFTWIFPLKFWPDHSIWIFRLLEVCLSLCWKKYLDGPHLEMKKKMFLFNWYIISTIIQPKLYTNLQLLYQLQQTLSLHLHVPVHLFLHRSPIVILKCILFYVHVLVIVHVPVSREQLCKINHDSKCTFIFGVLMSRFVFFTSGFKLFLFLFRKDFFLSDNKIKH